MTVVHYSAFQFTLIAIQRKKIFFYKALTLPLEILTLKRKMVLVQSHITWLTTFHLCKNNNANLHNFPTLSLDNPVFEPCSRHWAVAAKHRTPKMRGMPFVGILPSNWDLAWLHFTDARLGVTLLIYRLLRDFSDSIRGVGERDLAPAAHSIWVQWRVRKISCIYVWLQKHKKQLVIKESARQS